VKIENAEGWGLLDTDTHTISGGKKIIKKLNFLKNFDFRFRFRFSGFGFRVLFSVSGSNFSFGFGFLVNPISPHL
jgi:hypothetical protein